MAPKRRTAKPTEEERELWRRTMRDVRPIRKAARQIPPAGDAGPDGDESPEDNKPAAGESRRAARPAPPAAAPVRPPAPPPLPPLSPGNFAGVDRRTAERLRRGRLPIEATIDLHGMTQAEAHRALDRFILDCADSGRRCVIVVTGKGRASPEGGVLKRQVPLWLNQPGLRRRVLAIAQAQPPDGGEGALYVLLRRRRDRDA